MSCIIGRDDPSSGARPGRSRTVLPGMRLLATNGDPHPEAFGPASVRGKDDETRPDVRQDAPDVPGVVIGPGSRRRLADRRLVVLSGPELEAGFGGREVDALVRTGQLSRESLARLRRKSAAAEAGSNKNVKRNRCRPGPGNARRLGRLRMLRSW